MSLILFVVYKSLVEIYQAVNFDGDVVSFIPNLIKYFVIFTALSISRPAKQIRLSTKAIIGLLLSFGAPVFLYADKVSIAKYSHLFLMAGFIFYIFILILSLAALGRNFGVLPALRSVVSGWPFNAIRHPMYASYFHLVLLVIIVQPSAQNLILCALSFIGLYLRAVEEEQVLSQEPQYIALMKSVPRRFFAFTFSLPIIIAAAATFGFSDSIKGNSPNSEVKVLFPYPVFSIDPLVYDEWHSVFIGNHIYRRLIAEVDRGIPGVAKTLDITCADIEGSAQNANTDDCKRQRVLIQFESFNDCNSNKVEKTKLKNEFIATLNKMNWIFPEFKECTQENIDVCVEGPAVADLQRRLQNLYLRFQGTNLNTKYKVGTGPYCLKVERLNPDGAILQGALEPHPDYKNLPIIRFDTTEDQTKHLDLALFGFSESKELNRAEVHSHTPLGYYLVSHTRHEKLCLPWDDEQSVALIQKHLVDIGFTFADAGPLKDLLSTGGEKKCDAKNISRISNLKLLLPSFVTNCSSLAQQLNNFWQSQGYANTQAYCGDTTKHILEKVIKLDMNWDGYLSPLSPGYPGRNAVGVQYFSNSSAGSWVPGASTPELSYRLVGVGKSNVALNSKRFCNVRPSALGLGDLFITDLVACE